MPYIIDTNRLTPRPAEGCPDCLQDDGNLVPSPKGMWTCIDCYWDGDLPVIAHRAVATLDCVVSSLYSALPQSSDYDEIARQIKLISKSGGTIGPLPDGTVISVQEATYPEIGGPVGIYKPTESLAAEIIDAYNCSHGTADDLRVSLTEQNARMRELDLEED